MSMSFRREDKDLAGGYSLGANSYIVKRSTSTNSPKPCGSLGSIGSS
jgi:hypothetical protein